MRSRREFGANFSINRRLFSRGFLNEFELRKDLTIAIENPNGRVSIIADQRNKLSINYESADGPIFSDDVKLARRGDVFVVAVRPRKDQGPINLTVHLPARSKVKIVSETGAVDIIGNVELADVRTNTGTIRADVPLEALKFDFTWDASRPRYLSEVELPQVKQRNDGGFAISGKLGNRDATGKDIVSLNFKTRRGIVLLNVDPILVPSDLRDRPLTEAARAIVRSGDSALVNAIREASPRMFGDYARTLPPLRTNPSLAIGQGEEMAAAVTPKLMRLNVSVSDRSGKTPGDLGASDFTVYENGIERAVVSVAPANEPFNLVLLLDVSGSVEERVDFMRKAARDFLKGARPQDRVAIVSFRDDVQVVSEFTTDRALPSKKLDEIDAGGATALYDALGYVLVDTLKPLRGDRTAVVILSDGDDNKSFIPFQAVLQLITEAGALIYPLYVPSGLIPESSVANPAITTDPLRTRYLTITTRAANEGRKLASVSAGGYFPIHQMEDLPRAFEDIMRQLNAAYTLTYATDPRSSEHRTRVRVNREGVSIRVGTALSTTTP